MAADRGKHPVKAEVPGLLDVAAKPERSRELHRDEPVGPGHDRPRRRQRVRCPASSATTRSNVAEERTERAVASDWACGANMSEYATGFEWANPR